MPIKTTVNERSFPRQLKITNFLSLISFNKFKFSSKQSNREKEVELWC